MKKAAAATFLLIFLLLSSAYAATPKVLFVSPSFADDPFFKHVEQYTKIAADNLGLQLDIIYGDGNRLWQLEQLTSYFRQQQPEYIAVQTYSGGASKLMDFLAGYPATKVITLERIILPNESKKIGIPGEIYPNWFAEIYFDNASASQLLTNTLLEQCRSKANAGRKGVVGLNGANGLEAQQRGEELIAQTQKDADFTFHQIVPSQWLRELAESQSQQLLIRYPDTSVIWAASDWIALGVLDMIKKRNLNVANYCIGGFDWIPQSIEKISLGEMVASVGGHYMIGAWAMVAIYDHWHANLPKHVLRGTPAFELEIITAQNVAHFQQLLTAEYWQSYNFRSLTFTHNPHQTHYRFKLDTVINTKQNND